MRERARNLRDAVRRLALEVTAELVLLLAAQQLVAARDLKALSAALRQTN